MSDGVFDNLTVNRLSKLMGNVGIGTTTLDRLPLCIWASDLGWGAGISLDNGGALYDGIKGKRYGISSNKLRLAFFDMDNNIDRLVIDKDGKVGIGTIRPEAGLHINKETTNDLALKLSSSGPGWGSGIIFENVKSSTKYGIYTGNFDKKWHFSDETKNIERLTIDDMGNVGIGTTSPSAKLNIDPQGKGGIIIGNPETGSGGWTSLIMGISAKSDGYSSLQSIKKSGSTYGDISLNPDGGNVGIGTTSPSAKLEVNGDIKVTGDVFLTGADCAEEFDVAGAEAVDPGTVMVIEGEGALRPSEQAYDKRVAGVISGAGDLRPSITLDRQSNKTNRLPLALSGKVYCKIDAQYGIVGLGDLLTTSPTYGHAMKADDPLKAFGSVIGKALRPMETGRGMIPILIALQ